MQSLVWMVRGLSVSSYGARSGCGGGPLKVLAAATKPTLPSREESERVSPKSPKYHKRRAFDPRNPLIGKP
eukprot:3859850-Amphidinium_carterae.1